MRVLLQDTARVESEIFYRSLSIEEGARFEGVASPRLDPLDLNPLDEDIGVSPMAELRQSVARVGAGTPNGAAPGAVPYRRPDRRQADATERGRRRGHGGRCVERCGLAPEWTRRRALTRGPCWRSVPCLSPVTGAP